MSSRRRRQVPVPDVVVHELLEPLQRAGRGIERDQAVAVEVLALAIAAVEVGGGRSGRRKDEAALDVDGQVRPGVRARAVLPAVALPRLDARLAGARHGVKRPQQLAAARVPAANVAVESRARRAFAVAAAGDDDVAVDDRRRVEHEGARRRRRGCFASDRRSRPRRSRRRRRRSSRRAPPSGRRARPSRGEPASSRHPASTPRRACSSGRWRRTSRPALPVSGSSANTVEPAGQVHQAVDDEGRDLEVAAAGVERPGLLQVLDVLPGDLTQGRVALCTGVMPEGRPVACARGRLSGRSRCRGGQEQGDERSLYVRHRRARQGTPEPCLDYTR